jgi:hypothetical protein
MKNKIVLFSLFLLLFSSQLLASPIKHRVVEGDTLKKISQKYYGDELKFWPIVKANNISNPDRIFPGQLFLIPSAKATDQTPLPVAKQLSRKHYPKLVIEKIEIVQATALAKSVEPERCRGWRWGAAYAGGGGALQAGTDFKFGSMVLNFSGGVGAGQNYYLGNLQLSKEFGLPGDLRLGLSGVYAYYSKYIINVPWTSQVLDLGNNFGLGAYLAKDLGADWELRGGYAPVIGPNFSLSRYF